MTFRKLFQSGLSRKPLTWLVIGLLFGQVPSLAYALRCATMGADDMACCCSGMACSAPQSAPAGAVEVTAPANTCDCAVDSAPLPAETPSPPATRADAPVRFTHSSVSSAVLPIVEATARYGFSSQTPPPLETSTLACIRAVVLLI